MCLETFSTARPVKNGHSVLAAKNHHTRNEQALIEVHATTVNQNKLKNDEMGKDCSVFYHHAIFPV